MLEGLLGTLTALPGGAGLDGGDVAFTTDKCTTDKCTTEKCTTERVPAADAREVGAADGGGGDFPPKEGGDFPPKEGPGQEEVDDATAEELAGMFGRHAAAVIYI